jgi:hypothetical protein
MNPLPLPSHPQKFSPVQRRQTQIDADRRRSPIISVNRKKEPPGAAGLFQSSTLLVARERMNHTLKSPQ